MNQGSISRFLQTPTYVFTNHNRCTSHCKIFGMCEVTGSLAVRLLAGGGHSEYAVSNVADDWDFNERHGGLRIVPFARYALNKALQHSKNIDSNGYTVFLAQYHQCGESRITRITSYSDRMTVCSYLVSCYFTQK